MEIDKQKIYSTMPFLIICDILLFIISNHQFDGRKFVEMMIYFFLIMLLTMNSNMVNKTLYPKRIKYKQKNIADTLLLFVIAIMIWCDVQFYFIYLIVLTSFTTGFCIKVFKMKN
ncbi:membrane hypothetical protein [Pseudolactococcus piscium]|nr:membrane hypothetical protein [Lactococcus piscium]